MISIKKRGAVYGVIGLMLCVAVYLNWSYFQSPTELTVAAQSDTDTAQTAAEVYGQITAVNSKDTSQTKQQAGTQTDTKKTDTADNSGFAKARLNRQTARDEALALLKQTLSDEKSSESQRQEATTKISTIAANSVKESKIEGAIQNKGFKDAVVYIEDGSITVSVASENGKLNSTDVAKIADIIVSETGADLSTIKISDAA